ncbi:PUF domain containing protein [Trichuris trichiura]|uniref:PUF domain containing protein n=1 Tax=Trichuris trichiura TaxID=36087 RepID=A0A077Z299_TRITR|nr:PUF domain containing protein [Trichuris trichiura]
MLYDFKVELVFSMSQTKKRKIDKFIKTFTKPDHRKKQRKTIGSEFSNSASAQSRSSESRGRLEFLSRIVYRKSSELVELFQTASGSRCFEELLTSTMSTRTESLAQQRSILLKCAVLLLENIDYLWSNVNSVHTLRCIGRVLLAKSYLPGIGYLDDDELIAVFNSLLEKILDWKHKELIFTDYLNEEAFSLLTQDYLRFDALHEGKFTAQLSSEALKETTEYSINQSDFIFRFWEQLIRLSPTDFPTELYSKHLQTHLLKLSLHRFANFPLQRFLDRCPALLGTLSAAIFIFFKPYVFQLANDKFGSRVVEATLDRSDTDGKALLLRNLVCHEKELLRTTHGKVLALKYFLATFSQDEFRWAKRMQKSETRQLKYKELLSLVK